MMWAVPPGLPSLPARPAKLPLCWEAKPDAPARSCTRASGHEGDHYHEYSGAVWPQTTPPAKPRT